MSRRRRLSPRERLVERLEEVGLVVEWHNIWCQEGADRHADLARWGAYKVRARVPLIWAAIPMGLLVHSWDTMTDCARRGVELAQSDLATELEIFAVSVRSRVDVTEV